MIETIITHRCNQCGSPNIVRNGHDYKGSQKYRCKACGSYGTVGARLRDDAATRARVKCGLLERLSLRGLERLLGISRRTIQRWLMQWMAQIPPLETGLVPARLDDVLELDELWSFVGNKSEQRWLWLALCRRTRQVVAYWVGDRSQESALELWLRIPDHYRHCASVSDGWKAYAAVFNARTHRSLDDPNGETNHVERWFNTLRQRLARFVRKTLAFSKRDDLHEGLLRLFIDHYNRTCISQ
jgi:IS1 family transposase/transposase-like protein